MITAIYRCETIACHDQSTEFMVTHAAGGYSPITGLMNQAVIGSLTMACTDSKNLYVNALLRSVFSYDFDAYTIEINLTANLLYSSVAFGNAGNSGAIYLKKDREHFYIYVFENGIEEVANIQKRVEEGADIDEFLIEPEEWKDVESIIDAYEGCVLR